MKLAPRSPGAFGVMLLLSSACLATQPVRAEPRAIEASSARETVARVLSSEYRSLLQHREDLAASLDRLPIAPGRQEGPHLGLHSPALASPSEEYWCELDLGAASAIDVIALAPVASATGGSTSGAYGFPVRFRVSISSARNGPWTVVADHSLEDFPNPGAYPVVIPTTGRQARFVRVSSVKNFARKDDWVFVLGELLVLQGNRNIAIGAPVRAPRRIDSPPQWSLSYLTDGRSALGLPVSAEDSPTNGYLAQHASDPDTTKWVQVELEQRMPIQDIRLIPARPTDFADIPGLGFPVRFKVELADDANFLAPEILFDSTSADFPPPGDNVVTLPAGGAVGRVIRVTATRMWSGSMRGSFGLAELQAYANNHNQALGARVAASDVFADPRWPKWHPTFLVDGFGSRHRLIELPEWLAGLAQRQQIERQLALLDAVLVRIADRTTVQVFQSALGLTTLLALGGGLMFWRQRRARRAEMESLRLRVAADLHDEIGSQLSSIALAAQLAQDEADNPRAARASLGEIQRVAREADAVMHDIVWLLKPGATDLAELGSRLREAAATQLAGMELRWEGIERLRPRPVGLEFSRNVYLLFKEALANIAKHAQAQSVHIATDVRDNVLEIVIRDDGAGFDPAGTARGNGLDNMHRRAAEIRATLNVDSARGRGTSISLRAPLR